MRHLFKISFIILFVSCLAGCTTKYVDIAENVRKVEKYDLDGERTPDEDRYEVKIEGHWYETNSPEYTGSEELADGSKVDHYKLTQFSKMVLKNRRECGSQFCGGDDSPGDDGW